MEKTTETILIIGGITAIVIALVVINKYAPLKAAPVVLASPGVSVGSGVAQSNINSNNTTTVQSNGNTSSANIAAAATGIAGVLSVIGNGYGSTSDDTGDDDTTS